MTTIVSYALLRELSIGYIVLPVQTAMACSTVAGAHYDDCQGWMYPRVYQPGIVRAATRQPGKISCFETTLSRKEQCHVLFFNEL
jgi:hypothetical protein